MFQNALLVAIEGVDGAGKNTLTSAVAASLGNAGVRVSRIAFPRYGTLYADLVSAALHGQMGDLVESAYAMATLFALDRKGALHPGVGLAALTEAAREEATNQPHIILMDRWVASNAAYSAARIQQPIDEPGGIVEWVADLEFSRFGLPVPTSPSCSMCLSPLLGSGRRAGKPPMPLVPVTSTSGIVPCRNEPLLPTVHSLHHSGKVRG